MLLVSLFFFSHSPKSKLNPLLKILPRGSNLWFCVHFHATAAPCNISLIVLGCFRVILLFTPVSNNAGSFLEWKMDFSMANNGTFPFLINNLTVLWKLFSIILSKHWWTLCLRKNKYRTYFTIIIINNWNKEKDKKQQRDEEANDGSESSTPAAQSLLCFCKYCHKEE